MKKTSLSPKISTFPMPAAVISVGTGEEANLITLAYVGKVCADPPIVVISIRPHRHSYQIIEKLPNAEQLICSIRSIISISLPTHKPISFERESALAAAHSVWSKLVAL